MKIGSVVGSIWATRKAACLQGQTFLVVRSGAEELVAADQVGAGPGDQVLLGHGNRGLPVLHGRPGGRRRGGDFRQ